jgi:hypothetical protein
MIPQTKKYEYGGKRYELRSDCFGCDLYEISEDGSATPMHYPSNWISLEDFLKLRHLNENGAML